MNIFLQGSKHTVEHDVTVPGVKMQKQKSMTQKEAPKTQ